MTNLPRYKQVAALLREKIASGAFAEQDRLPSEPTLAQELGVARTTLREALYQLEEEGLIFRRKGVGSFINQQPPVRNEGIEKLQSYTQYMNRRGQDAKSQVLSIREIRSQQPVAAKLAVPVDSIGYMIESIRLASNIPVIYCCETLPQWTVHNMEMMKQRLDADSILAFLEGSCGLTVASTNQRAHVTLADSPVSDVLEIPSGTPLLQMKGVAYDGHSRPLYMLNDYFRSDLFDFTIISRK